MDASLRRASTGLWTAATPKVPIAAQGGSAHQQPVAQAAANGWAAAAAVGRKACSTSGGDGQAAFGAAILAAAALPRLRRAVGSIAAAGGPGASRRAGPRRQVVLARAAATSAEPAAVSAKSLEWSAERVRKAYIDFFVEKKQHDFVPSSPVVPLSDPTLLFANAGMNQFKAIFMGQLDPSSPMHGMTRAANSQKCIRAGGKHNDLDDVGRDSYHHTFFEMLGNWSFGDYFKVEAIDFAWELLTSVYQLEPERLYASYFGGDEELGLPPDLEAKEMWERYLPPSRVLPFGKGDNFWEMGAVGPCGPCSELHYDRIGGRDAADLVNADDPDVLEIWNLVFMQFYRDESGQLTELPSQHIDTGMGFERVVSILQDQRSNYDTDLFMPLFDAVHKLVGGAPYGGRFGADDADLRDTAYRVIVDHARTLTFAVTDGAVPSSEGRGYVLRRILRRAVRYGRQMLDAPPGFFSALVPTVVASLGTAFPELVGASDRVQQVLQDEEAAFDRMVERGMQYFADLRVELDTAGVAVVPGDRAFFLYDTHGFPVDLTQQMAEEAGLSVDLEGFTASMEQQKERSREAQREQQAQKQGMRALDLVAEQTSWLETNNVRPTDDAQKYEWRIRPEASVRAIYTENGFVETTEGLNDSEGSVIGIVLDKTPFYAEAGGQVSDIGRLCATSSAADSTALLEVRMVKLFGGFALHSGLLPSGSEPIRVGDTLACEVDYDHRQCVAPNHTMTHTLNWALRQVLGEGCDQRGSLVTAERLRFDFSSDAVNTKQLEKVERLVQEAVESNLPVSVQEVPLKIAQSISGLRAVAGEAYPDPVRVVTVGSHEIDQILSSPGEERWASQSVEFCGGTHIKTTAEAQAFVILEEKAIAKGIRRIIGATGKVAQAALAEGSKIVDEFTALEANKKASDSDVNSLSKSVDAATISAVLKADCRERLDKLRKKLRKKQKGADKAMIKEAKEKLAEAAKAAAASGLQHCVLRLDGLDAKVLQQVISGAPADMAALVLASAEDGTVNCVASVPETCQREGAAADGWVRAALAPLGGTGGGKPGRAQGSAKDAADKAAEAEAAAANFWLSTAA